MNKIKKILVSFMALAIVSAMPLSASAAETSTATSSQSQTSSQTETTSQSEPDKPESQPSTSSEENSSPESSDLNYLFSDNTSGNADLIASQEVIADDGKFQFLAVTTRDKDVFYIIIDKMKAEDNVYFLNEVDTYDLQKLMSKNSDNSENSDIEYNTSSDKSESSEESGEESQSSETSDSGMTNILLIGGVIVLGIIGFIIFKIKKGGFGNKKETVVPFDDFEEDEEINDDEESKKE